VAVPADDGHPWLGQTELGADDMDDALVDISHRIQREAKLGAVSSQGLDLGLADRISDRARCRGDVVIFSGQGQSGRRTPRPASLSPSNAWGLVTSCSR